MKRQNCAFEKIELLPRNIGYLKLNSFPDPEVCRVAAMAAMTYVNHADAIIFDLRDNGGGNPEMAMAPTRKKNAVCGMRRIKPPNFSMLRVWVACKTEPAPRKSRHLKTA